MTQETYIYIYVYIDTHTHIYIYTQVLFYRKHIWLDWPSSPGGSPHGPAARCRCLVGGLCGGAVSG